MYDAIPRIVLTGGPCAGKTTALAKMSTWASNHGFTPLLVPEAATLLINGGLNPTHPAFQKLVLSHVLRVEEDFHHYAQSLQATGEKPLLICDRGLCDQRAYMDADAFATLCAGYGIMPYKSRDERYAGIIFLRSAAVGAPEFYSSVSNKTRYETLEEAAALDERTLHAWMGAPHLSIINNEIGVSFDTKIQAAVAALSRIIGIPEPLEIERKFLVVDFSVSQLPPHAVGSDIVQTYLVGPINEVERVRARGQDGQWVYTHTIKEFRGHGVAVERERIVSRAQYEDLLVRRDLQKHPIHKTRYCFVHDGQYCELDVFRGHLQDRVLLEIEVASLEQTVLLPPYLSIVEEVTTQKGYANSALASAHA